MKLFKNLITLFIWQGSIYIVPLIITPYLARTLGVAQFGILGVSINLISYVALIADWGFTLSATRAVARNVSNPVLLREIFWEVVLAKLCLGAVSLTVFLLIVMVTPSMRAIAPVLLALILQVMSSIFSANWLLQGMERMVSFAVVSLLGRLLIIPLTLFFVHSPADTAIAAAIQGGTLIISSVASFVVAARAVKLLPIHLSFRGAWNQIHDGASLFLSQSAISLYTQANLVVLGFITGPMQAGLFSGADRMRKSSQGLTGPISTAVYPRINNLMTVDPPAALRLMFGVLLGQGGLTLLISGCLYFFADYLTRIFLGPAFVGAVPVLKWLSVLPFTIGISNALGINMMLPLGMRKEFTGVTLASGILNLALLIPLCHIYGAIGAAVSVSIVEILVTLAMGALLYVNREKVMGLATLVPASDLELSP